MAKRKKPTLEAIALGKRIKQCRDSKHLSQTALGKTFRPAITRNAISQWESGKASPENARLRELAVFFDVNNDWLATGRGNEQTGPERVLGLQLAGEIEAGAWHEVVETQETEMKRAPVAPVDDYPVEAQYALQVSGNSVDRVAKDGAIIHCVDTMRAGIEPRPGDLVCVERRRGHLIEMTVKRLRKVNGALELWPESNDPSHQEKLSYKPPRGNGEVFIKAIVIGVFHHLPRGS